MNGRREHAQAGFTLIEALIALLVIMIGLLGVAGMQALAVRNSTQAHIRTLAGLGAHGLAATMRANHAYWASNTSLVPSNVSIVNTNGAISITPSSLDGGTNCAAVTCTPEQSAGYAIAQWSQLLKQLPSGSSAGITLISTAGTSASAYTVQISWSENKIAANGQSAVTGPESENRSTTVVVKP